MPVDIDALREQLREYDPTVTRCGKTIIENRYFADDEDGMPLYMDVHHRCVRPFGHDGKCRNSRPAQGWPAPTVVAAMLDEIETLRVKAAER